MVKNAVYAQTNEERKIKHWLLVTFFLVIYDIAAVNLSYFFGLLLRFDLTYSAISPEYLIAFAKFSPVYTLFAIIVFYALRLYNSLWRFASVSELSRIFVSSIITTLFQVVCTSVLVSRMPISYYIIGAVMQFVLVTSIRFAYRFITLMRAQLITNQRAIHNAMIIGAGSAGQMVINELLTSEKAEARPLCIIDDNANKWGRTINGVLIVGGRDSILEAVKKYNIDQILFAIPTASAETKRDILNICKETSCELKNLPGVYQITNGEILLSKMKPVAIEDLLGRAPIKANLNKIFQHIKGKRILVTGGGGSIGSELCKQIAEHAPKQLIIFDIYENNAYEIEQTLRQKYGDALNLVVLIGSVRDSRRINQVFEKYKPDIVYHAAAHKHVPLMETSPNEAIKNNVIGTYKTAYAALKNGTKRFVLISTDKAVNPTNIMGASKRLCEMVIQSMDAISRSGRMDLLPHLYAHIDDENLLAFDRINHLMATELRNNASNTTHVRTQFVAVRFGNVLGSNGSVIPLFKKQIEAGGPVTVTHPDVIRYFMTIPEAVSLVLQAGTYARGGEIFILDMGAPVKIDTLARNLIRLSGYRPDEDIKIVYSGLRPGEKLFEEKLMNEEGMKKTENELIHIGKPIPFDIGVFLEQLEQLAHASYENDDRIVELVKNIVPTFYPAGQKPTGNECKKSLADFEQELIHAQQTARRKRKLKVIG